MFGHQKSSNGLQILRFRLDNIKFLIKTSGYAFVFTITGTLIMATITVFN